MCTRDEVLTFADPVLFPSVPVTYVITMEGSERYDALMRELSTFRPTRTVVVVHHKPRSECPRPEWVTKASDDLWRNNIMIAQRDPSSPVLILEDDVCFLPRVRDLAAHIDAVVAQENCEVYSLGSVPFLSVPTFGRDVTILVGGSAHAVLYTARARQRLVRLYGDDPSFKKPLLPGLSCHDLEISRVFHMLAPARPCAVQAHPMTENREDWTNLVFDVVFRLTGAHEDGTLLYELLHFVGRSFGGWVPFALVVAAVVVVVLRRLGRQLKSKQSS